MYWIADQAAGASAADHPALYHACQELGAELTSPATPSSLSNRLPENLCRCIDGLTRSRDLLGFAILSNHFHFILRTRKPYRSRNVPSRHVSTAKLLGLT